MARPGEIILGVGSDRKIFQYFPFPTSKGARYFVVSKLRSVALWLPKDSQLQLSLKPLPKRDASLLRQQADILRNISFSDDNFLVMPLSLQEQGFFSKSDFTFYNEKNLGLDVDGTFHRNVPEVVNQSINPSPGDIHPDELRGEKVGLVGHIFYPELIEEIAAFMKPNRHVFKKFISVPKDSPLTDRAIKAQIPGVEVFRYSNQGHDIGPFIEMLSSGVFDDLSLICKIHGKRSMKFGYTTLLGDFWRRKSFLELLGGPQQIRNILDAFHANPNVGLIGPQGLLFPRSVLLNGMDSAVDHVFALAQRLGISTPQLIIHFFAGSMFWVRPQALERIRRQNIRLADFPAGHATDHQFSHAMERALGFTAVADGYSLQETKDLKSSLPGSVTETTFNTVKRRDLNPAKPACIFVTFARGGKIQDDVYHYCKALKAAGFEIALVVVSPNSRLNVKIKNLPLFKIAYVRANEGHDFGAIAATMKHFPETLQGNGILIANDSVVGPVGKFDKIMTRIARSKADFLGMVDTNQHQRHLQSWFLYFSRKAVKSRAFKDFWLRVRNQPNREAVILNYEVPMFAQLQFDGLKGDALFSLNAAHTVNPSLHRWEELLELGMPFVKRSLVKSDDRKTAKAAQAVLKKFGPLKKLLPN